MRALTLLLVLAGCYEPDARDCTVECAAADECADGQVCGADGFCAAPELAGQCATGNAEPQTVSLIVTIEGRGKVVVDTVGTCDSETSDGNCMFAVTPGVMRQLAAVEMEDREFISWTSTCTGKSSTCRVTPVSLTQVGAKFE